MLSVSDTTHVEGSPDTVFAALEHPQTQLIYDGKTFVSIEQLTPGPIGKGTRFRAALRPAGTVEYECFDFERGSLLVYVAATPFGTATQRLTFARSGDGTRVAQTLSLVPSLLGQLLWPVVLRRVMEDRVQSLNDRLKTYVAATSPRLREQL